jgi:hypothetical protein
LRRRVPRRRDRCRALLARARKERPGRPLAAPLTWRKAAAAKVRWGRRRLRLKLSEGTKS